MKIKKFITINEQVKENSFSLTLSFNESLNPILKITNTDIVLPISTNMVIDILNTADISHKQILNQYSIVQNEAEEFVKLVVVGSPEYKKIINSKTITTSKIKQGTLVKLYSEEQLIFIQTIRLCKQYYLRRIQEYLRRVQGYYNVRVYGMNEPSEKDIKNLFKTYNLFFDPVRQVFQIFNISLSNKRVVECFDIVPEYNSNNFNVKERFNLNSYLYVTNLSFIEGMNNKIINIQLNHNSIVVPIDSREVHNYSDFIAFNLSELKPLIEFIKTERIN